MKSMTGHAHPYIIGKNVQCRQCSSNDNLQNHDFNKTGALFYLSVISTLGVEALATRFHNGTLRSKLPSWDAASHSKILFARSIFYVSHETKSSSGDVVTTTDGDVATTLLIVTTTDGDVATTLLIVTTTDGDVVATLLIVTTTDGDVATTLLIVTTTDGDVVKRY